MPNRCDLLTITDLVAAIYRSAHEPSLWPDTIERLRSALGGARACLVRIGPEMRPGDVLATESDPAFDRAFAEDARLHCNAMSRAVDRMPIGPVVHHDEIWLPETFRRSPLWNEYLSPQDIHSALLVKTLETATSYWFVGASRGRRQSPLDEPERALLALLAPHFGRASEIGRALEVERRSREMKPWIGGLVGFVTTDAARQIASIDATADAILDRPGCGLRRRFGRLEVRACQAARFASLVRHACRTCDNACRAHDDLSTVGGGMLIAKADLDVAGAVDVLVSVSPGTRFDRRATFCEPSAVVAIRTFSSALPERFAATIGDALQLTPKEARIAAHLAAGRSLPEAASAERISINTARTHLKRVFDKTGTHQQSALVALLRTIEPMVPPETISLARPDGTSLPNDAAAEQSL